MFVTGVRRPARCGCPTQASLLRAEVLELTAQKRRRRRAWLSRRISTDSRPGCLLAGAVGYPAQGDVLLVRRRLAGCRRCSTGQEADRGKQGCPFLLGVSAFRMFRALATKCWASPTSARRGDRAVSPGQSSDVKLANSRPPKLETMFEQMSEGESSRCRSSSRPTCRVRKRPWSSPAQISTDDEVKVNVIHSAVGAINRIRYQPRTGFGRGADRFQRACRGRRTQTCGTFGVDIRYYNIIYDAVDEGALGALRYTLARNAKKSSASSGSVRVFHVSESVRSPVVTCSKGLVKRGSQVRLLRNHAVIHTGELESLEAIQDDVKEVRSNFECGLTSQLQRYQGRR